MTHYSRIHAKLGPLLLWLAGMGTITPAHGIQLANGKVFFDQVPRLEHAATTRNSTHVSRATYYFEIDVPASAGEPLKQVQVLQREGFDQIRFNPGRTRAYLDKRRGTPVEIEAVEIDDEERVTVVFSEAIAPGNKLFLALRPIWNPDTGGVYLFGVTAFPEGDIVHPQFLGYGRIHFFEGDSFGR